MPFSAQFEYESISDTLTFATLPAYDKQEGYVGYFIKANTLGVIIENATALTPALYGIGYQLRDDFNPGAGFVAQTLNISASPLVPGQPQPSPVPLPASAPLFSAGLIALSAAGCAAKRKKSAATI